MKERLLRSASQKAHFHQLQSLLIIHHQQCPRLIYSKSIASRLNWHILCVEQFYFMFMFKLAEATCRVTNVHQYFLSFIKPLHQVWAPHSITKLHIRANLSFEGWQKGQAHIQSTFSIEVHHHSFLKIAKAITFTAGSIEAEKVEQVKSVHNSMQN